MFPPRAGRGLLARDTVRMDSFRFRCYAQTLADDMRLPPPPIGRVAACVLCVALGATDVRPTGQQRFCAEHVMAATRHYERVVEQLEAVVNPTFREAISALGLHYPDAGPRPAWARLRLEALKHVPKAENDERRRIIVIQDLRSREVLAETVNLIVLDDPELAVRYDKKRARDGLDAARVMSLGDVERALSARTHRLASVQSLSSPQ